MGDPKDFFAAERTLLAWVRTGIALMGFGFVVARFGLFLQEIASVEAAPATKRFGVSLWIGTALVLMGVVVNASAAFNHYRTIQRLSRGQPLSFNPLSLGIIVAAALGMLGMLMAIYLIVL